MTCVIQAAGAVTPVGLGLPQTAGSLRTRVQLFEDLEIVGPDGEPLRGARVRLPEQHRGVERLVAMAVAALEESVAGKRLDGVPLILCGPEPVAFPYEPANLLHDIARQCSAGIDGGRSRMIARGRLGVVEALGGAAALLARGSEYVLVGGVDSLTDPERVAQLAREGRLIDAANSDGFVPGEAAVVLLLSSRAEPGALAYFQGLGAARESAVHGSDEPVTGLGLQQAIVQALGEARVRIQDIAYLMHDFSGEQMPFEELLMAMNRLATGSLEFPDWGPATCVGETGAAAAFVSLATLAFYHHAGVVQGPSLAVFTSDAAERGAVVLGQMQTRR